MRSLLFVPGMRPERFAKALACGADAVIVDLEDAVGASDKEHARRHVAAAAAVFATSTTRVLLRINGFGTPWFDEDLSLLALGGIDGVVLPKAENAMALEALARVTTKPILPIVESALGVWHVLEVAKGPGVERLIFGSVDFELDLDCSGAWEALYPERGFFWRPTRAAPLVGGGAEQVAQVNAAFSPNEEELAKAREVVEAFERAGVGVVSVDGRMVDLPVLLKARRQLAMVG